MNALLVFGKVSNRWFNLANKKVLITVIFPNGVKYLLIHSFISSLFLSIFALKFKSIILKRSTEKVNPKLCATPLEPTFLQFFFTMLLLPYPHQLSLIFIDI